VGGDPLGVGFGLGGLALLPQPSAAAAKQRMLMWSVVTSACSRADVA
jgi:hypothetical protein